MEHWEYSAPKYGNLVAFSPPRDSFFAASNHQIAFDFANGGILHIKREVVTPAVKTSETTREAVDSALVKKEIFTPAPKIARRRSRSVHDTTRTTRLVAEHPERSNPDAFPKRPTFRKSISAASLNDIVHKKFVSTAEAIYHLQKDTPERFRSRPNKNPILDLPRLQHLRSTIPRSPALLSKTRTRPVTAPSRKDIEDAIVQDMKKFKIRANPVNRAALRGVPVGVPVERRPATRPEPFNLTEVRKKPPPAESPERAFRARPVPKSVLEKLPEPPKKTAPCTVPKTPNITKAKRSNSSEKFFPGAKFGSNGSLKNEDGVGHSGVPLSKNVIPQVCKPAPFSFDEKDKERQLKKMEKIQKVLEEEKRLREFHANPPPSNALKKSSASALASLNRLFPAEHRKENKENKPNNRQESTKFKARPATILCKKPFVPVHETKTTKPEPVRLTTEQRSKERQQFDMQMKQKEEQLELVRKMQEEQERQKREEEVLALRAQLVHKAAPVRKYTPLVIQPSAVAPTVAKSPNFTHK